MPRGDDEDTDTNSLSSSSSPAAAVEVAAPHPSSTRPEDSQSMFLPEQTPSTLSSSSASPSSSHSATAPAAHRTPPPLPPAYQYLPQQQRPADHNLDVDYYDMHLMEGGDSLDDAERAARRLRAHGKRRQRDDISPLAARAGCVGLDNSELSCLPQQGQRVVQNQWFEFQWSTWNPLFNQVDNVHIYLFNGASGDQIGFWDKNKRQGSIQVQANDTFWGASGPEIQPDHNQTFPFYFVIIPSTAVVHNGETSEPTFTGIQTALPNSVLATLSTGSLASTASLASVSSVSAASLTSHSLASQSSASVLSTATNPSSSPGAGNTQNGGGGSSFPAWAIALITILAFLLLLAVLLGAYLIMRRIRKQREEEEGRRNSMGSASPMMLNDNNKHPPLSPTDPTGAASSSHHGGMEKAALYGAGAGAVAASTTRGGSRDGAPGVGGGSAAVGDTSSMMSGSDTTGTGMLSGADAAIVADAFRQAMRKPDFSGRPVEEDESPDQADDDGSRELELINLELAREGRDIRSVGSARDVKVQGSTP